MLIEFSISNYRSFRDKQTFSMVAAPRLRKRDNVFKPVVKGEKLPDLLKVAAIYGPNASGKSNLIKAFGIVKDIANRQPSAQATVLPIAPFRFDTALADQPTRIELHFICNEQRYEFDLALTKERIIEERLISYPNGKETLLYQRQHLATGDEYTFGEKLEGGKDLHELWRKSTGAQVLFIVQAVANSSEELNQLRIPFEWLKSDIYISVDEMGLNNSIVLDIVQEVPDVAKGLVNFLQEVDVPVDSIFFEERKNHLKNPFKDELEDIPFTFANYLKTQTFLLHKFRIGEAKIEFEEESKGTQNLIGFFGLWFIRSAGLILIVDELDSSLHPEIVVSLVKKHIMDEEPKQLIFTTHDTHLMDAKLLRRDQFWLTERDENGATQLRSIHDFEGREGEDLEKRYYEGRYRGLPFVRRG